MNVQWDGVSVRPQPETELDGTPLTITYGTSGTSSVTTLTMPTGSHTLRVSGDLMAKGTISNYSAASAFAVTPQSPPAGGFGLSANPSTLIVERGKSATTTVTVNRMAPFAGAVTLGLTAPPAGVSIAPATIAAGAPSATLRSRRVLQP